MFEITFFFRIFRFQCKFRLSVRGLERDKMRVSVNCPPECSGGAEGGVAVTRQPLVWFFAIQEEDISRGKKTMNHFREQFYNSVHGENPSQTKANSNIQNFDCDNYGRFTVEKYLRLL